MTLASAVTSFTNDLVTSPAALTNFASCAIAIGASYVSFPVAMVYLSHFWQGPAGRATRRRGHGPASRSGMLSSNSKATIEY